MKWMIASDIHGSAYYCRLLMQAFDREFSSVTAPAKDVQVMGQCVRLQRSL